MSHPTPTPFDHMVIDTPQQQQQQQFQNPMDEENDVGTYTSSSPHQMGQYFLSLATLPQSDAGSRRLLESREYQEMNSAFQRLQRKALEVMAVPSSYVQVDGNQIFRTPPPIQNESSVLAQQRGGSATMNVHNILADEVWFRILDYLECQSLSKLMKTCRRMRDLVKTFSQQRTKELRRMATLPHILQWLRAQEQIQGICTDSSISVPIPSLLLPHAVVVTHAGDNDFNGIYYCTEHNGNGFVFTKPIQSRYPRRLAAAALSSDHDQQYFHGSRRRQLRCILAKRFSNETLLWYASKEVWTTRSANSDNAVVPANVQPEQNHPNALALVHDDPSSSDEEDDSTDGSEEEDEDEIDRMDGDGIDEAGPFIGGRRQITSSVHDTDASSTGRITQRYAFWARLSQLGDTTPDLCSYPSQTSVLTRNNVGGDGGWQTLTPTQHLTPPTVELLLRTPSNW